MKGQDTRTARFRPNGTIPAMLLVAVLTLGGCSPGDDPGREKPITIGMEATAVNTLIYIAQNRNYFADNGLKVVINDSFPSGAAATERMLAGEADLSTTAELTVVRSAFAGKKTRILGSIDMFMHMRLISRKDLGIAKITDLAGKRIGVPIKTAADFKLGRFLDLNGIDRSAITIVDVQAPQAVESLVKGSVDAIVTWQPNVMDIEDRLGDKAAVWEVQSGQPMFCVLATSEKWAADNPDQRDRLMKSLLQAEDYLIKNDEQARDIVQKRLGYDDRYIRTIWPEHQFSLRLDQSLILAMEDQARWMIENRVTTEQNVPDFLDYVHADGLEAVKPQAVSIIR
jgi:NitT/TauT family transport system substrate-binding protein